MRVNVRFSEVNTKIDVDFAENHSRINADFGTVTVIKEPEPEKPTTIGTVVDDSISVFKQVPVNSVGHCYISKLGGYTHEVADDSTILAPIRIENAKPTAIKVHGANLIKFPYSFTSEITRSGVKFTVNADRGISAIGTPTGIFTYSYVRSLSLPAGTYTYSASGIDKLVSVLSIQRRDTGTFIRNKGNIKGSTPSLTFTITEEEAKIADVFINFYSGSGAMDETFYPMINRGSAAIPYTDYKEPVEITLPDSLTSLANLGLGLYDNEYNELDLVNLKYYSRCSTKTLVGTETFSYSKLGSRSRFNITAPTNARYWQGNTLSRMKCDYLNCDVTVNAINGNDALKNKIQHWQTGWFLYVDGTDFPDLATWQAYLAEHNMEVVYELEQESVTDINLGGFNPLIEVEGGGSIEFVTDSGFAPNSTVIYQTIE